MRKPVLSNYLCALAVVLVPASVFLASTRSSIPLYILCILSLLYFIRVIPCCRKRENLWMFFLVFIFSVPVNISIVRTLPIRVWYYDIFIVFLSYMVLLTAEEIILGYITRLIWPMQHKMLYYEEEELRREEKER